MLSNLLHKALLINIIWLDWSDKLQSWCKHIHIAIIRRFLNGSFLSTEMFVVLRKHAAHIHLNAALGSVDGAGMFANSFLTLFYP